MSIVLACLALTAFRWNDRPVLRRQMLAGPESPQHGMFELETPDRYVASPARPRRAKLWENRSNAAKLLQPIVNPRFVTGTGAELTAAYAALPPERRAFGFQGLTVDQAQGEMCKPPEIEFEADYQGQRYELRYQTNKYFCFTEPEPMLYSLTSTCTGALLASDGDLSQVVGLACTNADAAAHFPPGSTCLACLREDGDHARCVAEDRCRLENTRKLFAIDRYYDVLSATALACAPDFLAEMWVLVESRGEETVVPPPFVHGPIFNICSWFWREDLATQRLYCLEGVGQGSHAVLGDVLLGHAVYIRPAGSTETTHGERIFFASEAELNGVRFRAGWLPQETIGMISNPDLEVGYGANPQDLRPDGTDPNNIDHTYARDWIGLISVKTATRINGVPVSFRNRNLCTDEMWRGPDEKGRYFCKQPFFGDAVPQDTWAYDYTSFYYSEDPVDLELRPMMTLLTTGLTDPDVPGGHVVEILGSKQLADPDWDNCTWPKTFEPDEMSAYATYEQEEYTHTVQTYRFNKDPARNIRIALSTSWRRTFCPGGVAPD